MHKGADVLVDEEPGRFNVQLFGNVIADFGLVAAPLSAGTAIRLVVEYPDNCCPSHKATYTYRVNNGVLVSQK